ncbi:trichohyalin isoform X1 [Sinocyclocheilus anshuiensis]|uniref:trichohyalin isoform X1 n=1 Tax=Sinocyclocheilus anshuiensis TaxID=1608454 RepID=UPI0007BA7F64|nr:PREDICTED: trichohyalin-like isoform X1 [Sinocyclocheilus anshuiensis]XP_016356885.1 PREDICTED: trichohyalin-like isoform X1 [Sinocyclocheilus anshuiensis]
MDRTREKEVEPDSCDGIRERERFPATRRRDGEVDWKERQRWRNRDRHANGSSSVSEQAEYGDRNNERRKGDTFPMMTKPTRVRDRRIPIPDYERERHMGRPKDILYKNERDKERKRYRDMDMQAEREIARYREELRRIEMRRLVKKEPDRQREREKEFDSEMRGRRRESYPGVNDLSGMRERETDRDRHQQRDREGRYYPQLMERETESFSDRERRTDRQREGERSRKRDTKSEGDRDGDRGKERKREEDAKHRHKLYKSEGDSDAERRIDRVRERDRRREREAKRWRDMAMPRERDYREKGYHDPKGDNLERLGETDKPRDRTRDSKEKRTDRDAYLYTAERERYRDGERIRERDRYSERETDERERRRKENRETGRSKVEKSGQSSGELISGTDIEIEQRRAMRENLEDRDRENTYETDNERLKGRTEEEQEVRSTLREEEKSESFAAEEAVTKKPKNRIRKMWLEPRSERKESCLKEEYSERERARERYIQRYTESMTTGNEEEPEIRKASKSKSLEDKYRELERAGEFLLDVGRKRVEKRMEGDMASDKAMEPEWQMNRENVADNMEENVRDEQRSNEEGSEGESEAEKNRMMAADDGFVTVSSGGDDAEEEDFEDCKEFWEGKVPETVSGHSGTIHDREIGADEELENQTVNERADCVAPKGPLRVFCVIGQTLPNSQTIENSSIHPTVEEAADQHPGHNMDNQGEISTVNVNEAFERVEHCEQDIERVMDDLSLSPNEDKVEGAGSNDQATEGVTSLEGQMIPPSEQTEQDNQLFLPEPFETSGPCKDNGHGATETRSEDTIERGEKEPTGDTVEHFGSDDSWSTSEERKRCSTAPYLRWAKNVLREILGPKSADAENTRGSVTHIDTQTNTQTEGEREMDKLRKEEEIIEGGEEQQGGMERELNEKHDWLDPSSNQHMVSSEGEAEGMVEEVSKKKDSIEEVVLSSSSFRDLGNEARMRRRGFRKLVENTKEEEDDEEEGEGVGRDRRTRIFNNSDDKEDELCFTWSEMDLRKLGRTRKRNSKFFNSQLYQEYSDVVQNREILLSHSDSLSISASSSPNQSPKLSSRPLPPLPQVLLHPHTLSKTNSFKSLNVPQQSINRPSSPRLSISASSTTLWQDLPGVRKSPELEELTEDERRLQEVRFEVVTSEASYCRSLDIVVENFVMSKQLNVILSSQDKNWLFSRLNDVRAISHSFLSQLEEAVENDIMRFTVCDTIIKHCPRFKNVYVPYLTNQSYQDKTYQRLMQESHEFRRVVEKLERNPVCQRLPLRSFLILPFQRITRLKLLVQNIVKRTAPKTKDEAQAIKAMKLLEKMIQDSNESISQMKNIESLVTLNAKVDFECRTLPLISQSRRLVREGPVTELRDFSLKDREEERNVYMHLFNDYLLVSLRKEGGRFTVIDHAPVSELRVENCKFKLHSLQKNLFHLHIPQKALLLRTDTQANKLRWISALSRPYPEIDFSAVQDFSQMQCIRAFVAQQPDELSLEKADVLLVHQQSRDGWVEGTRLSDRQRGWAPESHLETIVSGKARKRNLLDTMKIATAAM